MGLVEYRLKDYFVSIINLLNCLNMNLRRDFFFKQENFIRIWILFTIVLLIAFSSSLRANFNYIDDLGRVAYGYKGWEYFNRFFSQYFSGVLHANFNFLGDISPFPQILALWIISLSGTILLFLLKKKEDGVAYIDIAAVVPIALSPYFLECLSYKFDSPYMAISIFSSVLPFVFKSNKLSFALTSIIGILITCTSYQASLGVYPMLVVAISYVMYTANKKNVIKDIINFISYSTIFYIISLLIFKFFILKPVNSYVTSNISILSFPDNFFTYLKLLKDDFPTWFEGLVGIAFISFVVSSFFVIKNKFTNFVLSILVVISFILLSFGLYPFLEKPLFATRAMYGFGVACSLIFILTITNINKFYFKLPFICVAWCLFSFSLLYGNLLYQQKKYTDFRTNIILNELNVLTVKHKINSLTLVGSIGHAPVLKNALKEYPVLNRLIPVQLQQNWMWGYYELEYYFKFNNIKFLPIDTLKSEFKNSSIVKEGYFQDFRTNGERLFIVLKDL